MTNLSVEEQTRDIRTKASASVYQVVSKDTKYEFKSMIRDIVPKWFSVVPNLMNAVILEIVNDCHTKHD